MLLPPSGLSALSLVALVGVGFAVVLGLVLGVAFGATISRWWAQRWPMPERWDLSARPVFNRNERRLRRHLVEALPGYLVLPKVPLVRICQPKDPARTRFWFEILGSLHTSFLVCSPAGRTLAAVDLDDGRPVQQRSQRTKEMVLKSCEVPYIRCQPGRWPTAVDLQQLVPEPIDLEPAQAHSLDALAATQSMHGDEQAFKPAGKAPQSPASSASFAAAPAMATWPDPSPAVGPGPAAVAAMSFAALGPATVAPGLWGPTVAQTAAEPASSLLWRDPEAKAPTLAAMHSQPQNPTRGVSQTCFQGKNQPYLQRKRAPTLLATQALPAPQGAALDELAQQRRA